MQKGRLKSGFGWGFVQSLLDKIPIPLKIDLRAAQLWFNKGIIRPQITPWLCAIQSLKRRTQTSKNVKTFSFVQWKLTCPLK